MTADGDNTAGRYLRVQVHRRLFRLDGEIYENVLIVRCDGNVLYRLGLPKAQARDLQQRLKAQLQAMPLEEFVDRWGLRDAFDEPNSLW